jgi:hypothetical protein
MLNGTRKQKLSGKMKIITCFQKPEEFSDRHVKFYTKYATVTFKTLGSPLFQRFLDWMMRRENIKEHQVTNVQVRMFPFRRENGKGLAGKFNKKGEILIYPKRLEFCRKLVQDFEKEAVYFYIKARAMATLIHELLHVRYSSNEQKVRQLTRKYFSIFAQSQNTRNTNTDRILNLMFLQ